MMSPPLPTWLLVLGLVGLVSGFKSGAPSSVCDSMVPKHRDTSPQVSEAPFSLVLSPPEDGRLLISLEGSLGFAGFMLQARPDPSLPGPLGTFVNLPKGLKAVNCGAATNAAVTHENNLKKQKVEVEWDAPLNYEGEITFVATVVVDYSTYWTGIKSAPIKVTKWAPSELDSNPAPSVIEMNFYNTCGKNKICVTSPMGCLKTRDCKAAVGVRSLGNAYEFEMLAKGSRYVAYGISNDNKMGGDSVVECVMENEGDPGSLRTYRSWNVPNAKQNKRLDVQDGLTVKEIQLVDNILQCKVVQDSKFVTEDIEFDMERTPYYLLLAAGSSLKAGSVGFHDVAYLSSQDSRLLADLRPSAEFDDFYNDCGVLKNCLGFPDKCVSEKNCKAVVSVLAQGSKYQFELKAKAEAYVAIGLSEDDKMGGDSIVECVRDENAGNKIKAFMSWNLPGVKANTRKGISQDGIVLINGTYIDGNIYCKFTREAKVNVLQNSFDLIKDKYFLLLAAGSSLKADSVGFHDLVYTASGEARLLSDVGELTVASKLLLRLHGAFMIAAWIGAASIGIVLARYFKQTWVGSSLCAKDLWFAWHRFFMLITWSLTLVGFALIFVEIGEWVGSSTSQTHAILGCVTTVLCFIQPIGAAFRPHPTARNRPVFNWLHWLIGNSAHILSIVTISFALPINKAELPDWLDWVLVAFVTFYVIIHLILSFSACLSDRSSGKRVNSFPMKDMSSRATLNPAERKQDAPHSGFRRFMLFIHILGILVFTAAIIIIVVLAPIEEQWKKLQDKIMSM